MKRVNFLLGLTALSGVIPAAGAHAQTASRPWMNPLLAPERRATLLEQQMTVPELIQMVDAKFPIMISGTTITPLAGSAGGDGYVAAIPRLGIPAIQIDDGGIGVTNPNIEGTGPIRGAAGYAVALPSQLATTATWNPAAALLGGAMIGHESFQQGFNTKLAGAMNLAREPRDGRTFEYAGEDPLLAGTIVGNIVAGIQSNHMISTIKHFALNDQETGRAVVNAVLDNKSARESDLLAFEIAQEIGTPGAVMCAYNHYNGTYSCENSYLLLQTLKGDWNYRGFVLSDYGAVHSALDINDGLDQESADLVDDANGGPFFNTQLLQALADGSVPPANLYNAVHRILRSMFTNGLFDVQPPAPGNPEALDVAADAAVSQADAEQGAVLLKNNRLLPLSRSFSGAIAVFGSNANNGVLSGGGSSQVYPVGGPAQPLPSPLPNNPLSNGIVWDPSPPIAAMQALAPKASFAFDAGTDLAEAAARAKAAQVAIVFVNQFEEENSDLASLSLGKDLETGVDQDALVAAVVAANPNTIVVLETGGPVLMPWLKSVPSVLEAWYPGFSGGAVIADLLFGVTNPSGHLPITFPASESQLPRPTIDGLANPTVEFDVDYNIEGANVGYKWFIKQGYKPLFPFGHGLSYTTFSYGKPVVSTTAKTVTISETVTNTGDRFGYGLAQIYASLPASVKEPLRLVGFGKVPLRPGESRTVTATVDPRLLARFNVVTGRFDIPGGTFTAYVGRSAQDLTRSTTFSPGARSIAP